MTVTLVNAQANSGEMIKYLNQFSGSPVNPEKLQDLAKESGCVLLTISAVFPFDLFPDSVIIDANKINVIRRDFFGMFDVHSVLITDVTDVSVYTGLLFATLYLIDSSNYRFPIIIKVHNLRKKEALLARQLIQGLISVKRNHVDLSTLSSKEIRQRALAVGEIKNQNQGYSTETEL